MKEEYSRVLQLMNAAQAKYVDAIQTNAPGSIRNEIWRLIESLATEMMYLYNNMLSAE